MYKLIRGELNEVKQKKRVNTEVMLHKIVFIYERMRKVH